MNSVKIENPWQPKDGSGRSHFVGKYAKRTWGEFRFLPYPDFVIAVLDGKAITQCVTIDGAIRELQRRGHAQDGTLVHGVQ